MEPNLKGSSMLKVSSILMIIGAGLGMIMYIITLIGTAALQTLFGSEINLGILYLAGGIGLVSGIIQLVAGIVGVKNCKNPAKAGGLLVWGIIIVVLAIVSSILTTVGGNDFPFFSFILGLVIPILYIVGAVQLKSNIQ